MLVNKNFEKYFPKQLQKTEFAKKQRLKAGRKIQLKNASQNTVINCYRCKNLSKCLRKKYCTKKLPKTAFKNCYRKITEFKCLSKTFRTEWLSKHVAKCYRESTVCKSSSKCIVRNDVKNTVEKSLSKTPFQNAHRKRTVQKCCPKHRQKLAAQK